MNFYLLGKTPDPSIDMSPPPRQSLGGHIDFKNWKSVHVAKENSFVLKKFERFTFSLVPAKQSSTKNRSETFQKMSLFTYALLRLGDSLHEESALRRGLQSRPPGSGGKATNPGGYIHPAVTICKASVDPSTLYS